MMDFAKAVVFSGLFIVLFIPLIVSNDMFFPFITGKNFWFRIIVEITLAAWVLLACYEPKFRPRFTWLLPSMGALLLIMLVANITGEYAPKSFWSNYERMDGYVTLVHFAAYFVVLGSTLSNRTFSFFGWNTSTWNLYMGTALFAALCVAFTAFQQLAGFAENTRDGWRINGSLGNAAYMAIYMLFNTFVALWVALQARVTWVKVAALALAGVFVFLLVQTGTRGTLIGFAGGTFLGALYIAIANTEYPRVRQAATGALVAVVAVVGILFTFHDAPWVQESTILNRATAINLQELNLRITIWDFALEGIAERPVLGWGQGNFNYIFNFKYDPDIAGRSEEWYDRGHNIFIDWLAAGGILGLVAYLSIWVAAAYYVLIAPWRQSKPAFTVTEQGLLLGIFSGYFIHNLVVFDNIVSYIFFALLLALVHSRLSEDREPWWSPTIPTAVTTSVIAPIVIVSAAFVVYYVNVPSMLAAKDIIDGFRATEPAARLEAFQTAYSRNGFAEQEITEQLLQQAMRVIGNESVPAAVREAYQAEAEQRLLGLIEEKPNDARLHVFATSFYRATGNLEAARAQAELARAASPEKPSILAEQGYIAYQAGDIEGMVAVFKEAYDLNPDNPQTSAVYAAGLVMTNAPESDWRPLLATDRAWSAFAESQIALIAAERTEQYALLEELFTYRLRRNAGNAQLWLSQSYAQYRQDKTDEAVATLEAAAAAIPEMEPVATCFIDNIEAGREPNTGC